MSDFLKNIDESHNSEESFFKYRIEFTATFKKEFNLMLRRGKDISKLISVINQLASGNQLPEINRDHNLMGNLIGYRECHIENDWLLIYKIKEDKLVLALSRTGSHSDLFKK